MELQKNVKTKRISAILSKYHRTNLAEMNATRELIPKHFEPIEMLFISCYGFNVYMELETVRETHNRALGEKNQYRCFFLNLIIDVTNIDEAFGHFLILFNISLF